MRCSKPAVLSTSTLPYCSCSNCFAAKLLTTFIRLRRINDLQLFLHFRAPPQNRIQKHHLQRFGYFSELKQAQSTACTIAFSVIFIYRHHSLSRKTVIFNTENKLLTSYQQVINNLSVYPCRATLTRYPTTCDMSNDFHKKKRKFCCKNPLFDTCIFHQNVPHTHFQCKKMV